MRTTLALAADADAELERAHVPPRAPTHTRPRRAPSESQCPRNGSGVCKVETMGRDEREQGVRRERGARVVMRRSHRVHVRLLERSPRAGAPTYTRAPALGAVSMHIHMGSRALGLLLLRHASCAASGSCALGTRGGAAGSSASAILRGGVSKVESAHEVAAHVPVIVFVLREPGARRERGARVVMRRPQRVRVQLRLLRRAPRAGALAEGGCGRMHVWYGCWVGVRGGGRDATHLGSASAGLASSAGPGTGIGGDTAPGRKTQCGAPLRGAARVLLEEDKVCAGHGARGAPRALLLGGSVSQGRCAREAYKSHAMFELEGNEGREGKEEPSDAETHHTAHPTPSTPHRRRSNPRSSAVRCGSAKYSAPSGTTVPKCTPSHQLTQKWPVRAGRSTSGAVHGVAEVDVRGRGRRGAGDRRGPMRVPPVIILLLRGNIALGGESKRRVVGVYGVRLFCVGWREGGRRCMESSEAFLARGCVR
ncbi:hypothetical protein FB451DRAFT_1507204 [Mycena latifolia]|nr:hypothetical protein FB451DRAFT_1507204 [Mycena latifolia]